MITTNVRVSKTWENYGNPESPSVINSTSCQHISVIYTLDPQFYRVKLGFTGVYMYIISLILLSNIHCGYSLEPPDSDGSYEY